MTTTSHVLTMNQAVVAFTKIVTGLEKQRGYEPGELLDPSKNDMGAIRVMRQGEGRWPDGVPVLVENYGSWTTTTDWAIVWEEGPYEWVHYLDGGIEEEWGFDLKPVPVPKDVFAEPIESFSLGLYPAS